MIGGNAPDRFGSAIPEVDKRPFIGGQSDLPFGVSAGSAHS